MPYDKYDGCIGGVSHINTYALLINMSLSNINLFCLLQLADFEAHFAKAEKDIEFYIPDKDFSGYAVIGKYCPFKF